MMGIRSLVFAVVIFLQSTVCSAGTVTLSDETFNNADWRIRTDGSIGDMITEGSQVPIGGNSGSWRQVINRSESIAFRFEQAYGWHLFDGQTYNPSNGAIESLTYSEDNLLVGGFFNALTGYFALEQDGFLYRSNQSYSIDSNSWTNNTFSDLKPTDFQAYFQGSFLPTAHPDFSTDGSPISFGFMRYTHGNQGRYRSETGIDNWRVELTTTEIPEPSSMFLACSAVAFLAARRK